MARVNGTVFERFLQKIAVSHTLSWNGTPCWIWTDKPNHKGYGTLNVKGKRPFAHRLSCQFFKGGIAPGLQPDHLCRVRNCVNPDHLEVVTPYENFLRGEGRFGRTIAERQRSKTHCPWGHEYTPSNTIVCTYSNRKPFRKCRQCGRDQQLAAYYREKYSADRSANNLQRIDDPGDT